MQGEVMLAGSEFDVRLLGGRFCGISRGGNSLGPRRMASSYMRVSGRLGVFRTINAFSIEGEEKTGLREELRWEGDVSTGRASQAALSVEYSFLRDSPLLSISAEIRYPRFDSNLEVDEYAPLALTLIELGRAPSATVEARAPDGSASSYAISGGTGSPPVLGASVRVRLPGAENIFLHLSPAMDPWGIFPFRIVRSGMRRFLEVNPFGSYSPMGAGTLSARFESYSISLGIEARGD
jgi:hypothetical protein